MLHYTLKHPDSINVSTNPYHYQTDKCVIFFIICQSGTLIKSRYHILSIQLQIHIIISYLINKFTQIWVDFLQFFKKIKRMLYHFHFYIVLNKYKLNYRNNLWHKVSLLFFSHFGFHNLTIWCLIPINYVR